MDAKKHEKYLCRIICRRLYFICAHSVEKALGQRSAFTPDDLSVQPEVIVVVALVAANVVIHSEQHHAVLRYDVFKQRVAFVRGNDELHGALAVLAHAV